MRLAVLLLIGCHRHPVDDTVVGADDTDVTDTDTDVDTDTDDTDTDAPGDVFRLGEADPTVGVYDVAVDASRGIVYATNLHVPFLTRVDATTGARLKGVDLRPILGDRYEGFPYVAYDPVLDRVWLDADDAGRLVALDGATYAVVADLVVGKSAGPFDVDGNGDVWIPDEAGGVVDVVSGDAVATTFTAAANAVASDPVRGVAVGSSPRTVTALDVATGTASATLDLSGIGGFPARVGREAWVPDREHGVVDRVDVSADPVVTSTVAAGADPVSARYVPGLHAVVVVDRQGAALPASGAYEGDPAVVVAHDPSTGDELWRADVGKTAHFVAWDPLRKRLWTANEDSLDLSALSADGVEVLRTAKLGRTLDEAAYDGDVLLMPSHLTDELVALDLSTGDVTRIPTSGWPLAVVADPGARRAWVACQDKGLVDVVDLDQLAVVDTIDPGLGTFQQKCDPLCDAHKAFTGAAYDAASGTLYVTSPPAPALIAIDTRSGAVSSVVLDAPPSDAGHTLAKMAVARLASGRVIVFEPVAGRLYAVEGGAVVATADAAVSVGAPVTVDGLGRVWVGADAYDEDLEIVATLPDGLEVVAADAEDAGGLLVASDRARIVTLDPSTLATIAELSYAGLRSRPYYFGDRAQSPLRFSIDPSDGILDVRNVFAATVERLSLPDLQPR